MFPAKKLPSGKQARSHVDDLKKKFAEFFIKYPDYDWDLILEATEKSIDSYRNNNFMYMKTSSYYIFKDGESDLAADCESLLEGEDVDPGTKFNNFNIS